MAEETVDTSKPLLGSMFDWLQSARQAGERPSVGTIANAIVDTNGLANTSRAVGTTPAEQSGPETATVQELPGVDNSAGGRADLEGQGALGASERGIFQGMYGTPGQAPVMDEGADYLGMGGPQGKENVQDTFFNQPDKLRGAVREGADAQQREAAEKQSFYVAQRDRTRDYESALKEQYMLRQQEAQSRMAEIEQKTRKYTDNLSDTGAFWHNPQNVIGAIGAALMQLTTDDRSFGYKLLNGAIQADLHQRRTLADTHLGYLKSNMAEYDRIAGDRIAGMQLAEAEAKRVAAYELERISQQFQGPKAKANAEAIISKLNMDVMQTYMDFYRTHIYNKPQHVDQGILNSYNKSGKAVPGVGYSSFAGGVPKPAGAGPVQGRGLPGGAVGTGGGSVPGGGVPAPGAVPARGSRALKPETLKVLEGRFPGATDLIDNGYNSVSEAAYLAAGVRPGTPEGAMSPAQRAAYNKEVGEQRKQAYESMGKVASNLKESSTRVSGLKAIQTDMSLLEAATGKYGLKMDDVLSSKSRTVIGNETLTKLNSLYDAHIKTDPEHASKWEIEKQNVNAAANRFMQLLSGDIREYYKGIGGSALTKVELPGLEQYANTSAPFQHIKNYIGSESNKMHALERGQFIQMTPAAQAMWLTQLGQGQSPLLSQSVDAPENKMQHNQTRPAAKVPDHLQNLNETMKGFNPMVGMNQKLNQNMQRLPAPKD